MLRWRLIFAAAFLTPLLALLYLDFQFSGPAPGIWLVPLGLLMAVLATKELADLLSEQPGAPSPAIVMCGVAGVYLAAAIPTLWGFSGEMYPADCPIGRLGWPLCATVVAVCVVFVVEMKRFAEAGTHVLRVAVSTFVIVYIGLLLSFLVALRSFQSNETGMAALVSVILIVKMSDTGAYTFGRLLGRHPMAPRLSPKKTLEGAAGGLLTAAVVSWLFFSQLGPTLFGITNSPTPVQSIVYGVLLGLAGMIGDLCESLIKRDVQKKDSSGWIRGLGGMLDVLDSLLLAAPVGYLCWAGGLLG